MNDGKIEWMFSPFQTKMMVLILWLGLIGLIIYGAVNINSISTDPCQYCAEQYGGQCFAGMEYGFQPLNEYKYNISEIMEDET